MIIISPFKWRLINLSYWYPLLYYPVWRLFDDFSTNGQTVNVFRILYLMDYDRTAKRSAENAVYHRLCSLSVNKFPINTVNRQCLLGIPLTESSDWAQYYRAKCIEPVLVKKQDILSDPQWLDIGPSSLRHLFLVFNKYLVTFRSIVKHHSPSL